MNPKNLNYYDSVAYEASAVIKASPGTVYSITGYNSHSLALWLQLHDFAVLPADNAIPALILKVPADSNFFYDFGQIGRFCLKGIVVCGSTTGPTKTLASAAFWLNIQYK
ncbi:MAG: hypothetical protein Q7J15_08010 [Candidatus Desulfaltia sp.]|nr:hypothetical protein [Candidatus Desulfaltia sp.]